jgi:molecular chaperone DnaK
MGAARYAATQSEGDAAGAGEPGGHASDDDVVDAEIVDDEGEQK